jgi:hypothetical protein
MAAPREKSFCVLEYHTSKSVVTMQRAFRAKYAKDPPADKTIRAWYKQFTETGCLCKQKSSGRPLTAEDYVERVGPPVVRTSKFYSCQKKNFFSFPVAVNNSIKLGPLVFLL